MSGIGRQQLPQSVLGPGGEFRTWLGRQRDQRRGSEGVQVPESEDRGRESTRRWTPPSRPFLPSPGLGTARTSEPELRRCCSIQETVNLARDVHTAKLQNLESNSNAITTDVIHA